MKKSKKQKFRPDWQAEVNSLLLDQPDLKAGHMFGYPAYYVNKKLAICLYEDGIALKLPIDKARALKESDPCCEAFCPMGKNMGNHWVILYPQSKEEIKEYAGILKTSVSYLRSVPPHEHRDK